MKTILRRVTFTSSSVHKTSLNEALRTLSLILLIVLVVVIPGPPMLGEWESLSFFSMYAPQTNSLALEITPWGNVGGQGYLLLDIGRWLVENLNLPFTLAWVRLPAKLSAIITIILFYKFARSWFGGWPALLATCLLAVNTYFLLLSNELVVVAPSLMIFALFLYVLQRLDEVDSSARWLAVGCVWAVALTMYGPLRIYATCILALWILQASLRRPLRASKSATRASRRGFALLAISALPLLLLGHVTNFRRLNLELFFPRQVEAVLFTESTVGFAQTIGTNFVILLQSLLITSGNYHSTFVEATFIQGRFPLLTLPTNVIAFCGLAVAFYKILQTYRYPANKYSALILMLACTILPLVTSQIFVTPDGLEPSLSNYRLALALIPIYLLTASLAAQLWSCKKWLQIPTLILFFAAFALTTASSIDSQRSFAERLDRIDLTREGDDRWSQWLSGFAFAGTGLENASHFQQHMQYRYLAESAVKQMERVSSAPKEYTVVYIPARCVSEAPVFTSSLGELNTKNFHGAFLALYVADERSGKNTGFVNIPSDLPESNFVMKHRGDFPGQLISEGNLDIDYLEPKLSEAAVVAFGHGDTDTIIATTPSELVVAKAHFHDETELVRLITLENSEACQ